MIELLNANTKNRKSQQEYGSALEFSYPFTLTGNEKCISVISNKSIEFVLEELRRQLICLYPDAKDITRPSIIAVCLSPSAFDDCRRYRGQPITTHAEEYGLSDAQWNQQYKSGGYLASKPVDWEGRPTWCIVINGRSRKHAYYTLRHEIKHIFEKALSLELGTLTNPLKVEAKRKE